MPKNNKVTKIDGHTKKQKVQSKNRIGTRKAGKAAVSMPTADLLAVLDNSDKRKWHKAARTVLDQRGALPCV